MLDGESSPIFWKAVLDPRVTDLLRMKRVSLACLLLAVAGLFTSVALGGGQGAHPGWAWAKAFCEAAVVGGLADWFAVVALFRRPMGLPIPHTALIPQGKNRIADSLAAFVRDSFLSPEVLLAKLKVFNPAERLGEWLRQPEHLETVAGSVRSMALEALSFLNEQSVRKAIGEFLVARALKWDAAATAGSVLEVLTHGGRHQQVLDAALERVSDYLATEEVREIVARRLVGYARKEWPKVTAVVDTFSSVDKMAVSMSDRLGQELINEVQKTLAQPDHAVRQRFDAWIADFIARLQHDEAFAREVNALKDRVVQREDVRTYLEDVWGSVRDSIEADIRRDDSALLGHLRASLGALGNRLGRDPSLAQAINEHVLSASAALVERLRDGVAGHISATVRSWDDRALVAQIELGVGRDLQFIRINGTVVGGLIGLVLYGATWLVAR